MENATKALLIAAGILFAVMIMSLLLVGYNQISSYYSAQHEEQQIKQLADYNKIFQNYNRKKIRGNEMISLMNRVIDYNERQAYDESKQYTRMQFTIEIGENYLDAFKYQKDIKDSIFKGITRGVGNITNILGNNRIEDNNLVRITGVVDDLKKIDGNSELNLTEDKLQKLSSNISNIMISGNDYNEDEIKKGYYQRDQDKRMQLLKDILGVSESIIESRMDNIKNATCKYYEFTQFKRAYFDCTNMEYDKSTGRIYKMEFKVKINGNTVVFN